MPVCSVNNVNSLKTVCTVSWKAFGCDCTNNNRRILKIFYLIKGDLYHTVRQVCKEVRKGLSKLKINKAEGVDSISNEMLKYGSSVITLPLVKLFNYILNSTDYPETWNISLISTIYKKVIKIAAIIIEV